MIYAFRCSIYIYRMNTNEYTPETNSSPLKIGLPKKERLIFQPSILSGANFFAVSQGAVKKLMQINPILHLHGRYLRNISKSLVKAGVTVGRLRPRGFGRLAIFFVEPKNGD